MSRSNRFYAWASGILRRIHVSPLAFPAACFCALLIVVPASAQSNALTVRRNLAELVAESGIVVQGRVTSVLLEPHAQLKNLLTVVVTLQVEDQLKGAPAKSYTFRQAVLDAGDRDHRMGYSVGQHLLLILMKPNQYGLSSPAGMEQGRFRIHSAGAGKFQAANGFANAGLFRGVDSHLQSGGLRVSPEVQAMLAKPGAGPVPLEHLKSLIRTISPASVQPSSQE